MESKAVGKRKTKGILRNVIYFVRPVHFMTVEGAVEHTVEGAVEQTRAYCRGRCRADCKRCCRAD